MGGKGTLRDQRRSRGSPCITADGLGRLMQKDGRRAAELAARTSYGRLLAILAAGSRDIAAAEDALTEAFIAALKNWPERGVPDNPEGWLYAAAKRRLIDAARHRAVVRDAEPRVAAAVEEIDEAMRENADIPDRRLGLLFACAHPADRPAGIASSYASAPSRLAPRRTRRRRSRAAAH